MNNVVEKREFRRGDKYWLRTDSGLGSEEGSFRPILIISSDEGNETCPTVIGAYLTTKPKYGKINVPLNIDGKREWFLGSQIVTADKSRLNRYMGSATEDEMYEIDEALRIALDLNYTYEDEDEPDDEEIEEEDEEEGENLEEKIADLELELKITKAAYDRLLEKVVEMRVEADVAKAKVATVAKVENVEPPKEEKPPVIEPPVVAPPVVTKLDVNTASETALKRIGWDSLAAKAIVQNRPYKSLEELKALSGITKKIFDLLAPRMECIIRSTEKVNINTATTEQIVEILGCLRADAGQIVGWRNKHGEYASVDELWEISTLSKKFVGKYYERFTVGDVVKAAPVKKVVEETVTEEKVNINTMKGPEIARILGCPKSYAGYIVTYRNKNGLYKDKAELFNVPHIRNMVEKNWDRFEL